MHFTYAEPIENADLQQGDVLRRTEALDKIIAKYHAYYSSKSDYTHFMILTQSCDLVRRQGKPCSAPYLSLAVVRPLEKVIEREVRRFQRSPLLHGTMAANASQKSVAMDYFKRLLNNNEKEHFYLHENPEVAQYSSCAFLRLAISIRANDHYDLCRQARIVSLNDEFRAKLGWQIGNIFARVGTTDWPEDLLNREVRKLIGNKLEWLEDEKIKATKIEPVDLEKMDGPSIISAIKASRAVKKKDQVIDAVIAELSRKKILQADQVDKAKEALSSATTITSFFK